MNEDTQKNRDLSSVRKINKKTLFILIGIFLIISIISLITFFIIRKKSNFQTIEVSRKNIQETIEVSGGVLSEHDIILKASYSGLITAVPIPENQKAKIGELLLKIDDQQANLQLNQTKINAENSLRQAKTELDNSQKILTEAIQRKKANSENLEIQIEKAENRLVFLKNELSRSQELFSAGALAEQNLKSQQQQTEQAEIDLRNARDNLFKLKQDETEIVSAKSRFNQAKTNYENAIKQGEASVKLAEDTLKKTLVLAPFSGTVTKWQVDLGDYVVPGTPLGRFQDLENIYLRLAFNELDLPKINGKSKVSIIFDAYDEKPYVGNIFEISQSGISDNESIQVFPVKVKFANKENLIKPGMSGDAKIIINEKKNVLAVPLNTVIRKDEGIFVKVLAENKKVKEVKIEPGINNLELLEVKSGLNSGDKIIIPENNG